jgi:phage terminase large subunit-like protein
MRGVRATLRRFSERGEVAASGNVRAGGVGVSALELAALAHTWEAWARPKQIPPPTSWRSFGYCTGRGFGKTRANVEFVIGEVMAGRARNIIFAAQNLDETERTMMHGPSGLIACSPPWFPADVNRGQVVWPNGATATPLTPEVPNGPRGGDRDLAWMSEIAAWPAASREEFFSNVKMSLRHGLGRMVYDMTPKARNPLVRKLIERADRDPRHHVLVRGASRENMDNLTPGVIAEWEAEYGGTQRGREELDGQFFDDAEGALWKQSWIDDHRRDMPTQLRRRIISIDPAISTRRGTDATGVVDLGLGIDGQAFVIADHTDRMAADVWGALVIDLYVKGACDCVVVERNRGGELVAQNLRACAERRGLRVEVVEPNAVTRHSSGTVLVKETHARKAKALRAEPVASLYEAGRVSHVRGADLADLEESLCTWLPDSGGESPNALDALVHGVVELAGLGREQAKRSDVVGVAKLMATVSPRAAATNIATLLGGRGGGDRI